MSGLSAPDAYERKGSRRPVANPGHLPAGAPALCALYAGFRGGKPVAVTLIESVDVPGALLLWTSLEQIYRTLAELGGRRVVGRGQRP